LSIDFAYIVTLALLVFGFGFVIFWHELGHFLAAKWAGVRVEQFAVGFGHAIFSWRKGLGIRRGSSRKEYESRVRDYLRQHEHELRKRFQLPENASEDRHLEYASKALNLGETEYRLNWIPLGGYVKMLGQDDMDATARSDSPRSYNNKSIGKRMVIVSAGVIMNVILAVFLFTVLFRIGFDAPPAVCGAVEYGSPAQEAGLRVGDRIAYIDGDYQHDFNKIAQSVALLHEGSAVPIVVQSPDGAYRQVSATPRRSPTDPGGFLRLGIEPSPVLQGLDPDVVVDDLDASRDLAPPEFFLVRPGDVITAINGEGVDDVRQYYKLDAAIQKSFGATVTLTLRGLDGQTRQEQIKPGLDAPFGGADVDFAGMVPRSSIVTIISKSPARGKLKPGDVVLSLTLHPGNDPYYNPSPTVLRQKLAAASKSGGTVDLEVLRDGQTITVKDLSPQTKLETGTRGLGIGPGYDQDHPVIGDVLPGSAAARANITPGSTIVSIDSQPVSSWHDVHRILASVKGPGAVNVVTRSSGGEKSFTLDVSQAELKSMAAIRYTAMLALRMLSEPRRTTNPLTAISWGVTETRDLILQFYLTLKRMSQGSVSPTNAMGPIGIFQAGSRIAHRGTDWLIWFLAMISANLAVVNFLPVPIVDGGLFVFLILEKVMGKPLSPRAQGIAQLVGLALIASVFLFVTYNDITRLF
jgi:regulator of sigma E protease